MQIRIPKKVWKGNRIKPSVEIEKIARRKLRMLNNSINLNDLMIPPSNRLEKLKSNSKTITPFVSMTYGESCLNGIMEMHIKF